MSEARIVSEWLAQGLAIEAREDAQRTVELAAEPDAFAGDFGPTDPHHRLIGGLVRGLADESLAAELEIDLAELDEFKRRALDRQTAELPTVAAVYAVIEAGLTEVTRRAYLGLDDAMPGERSDLLNVLVGIYRLRLESLRHHPIERKA